MKKPMVISVSRNNVSVLYKCYNLVTRYGKKCEERDDSNHCMTCKYCKAEMSGYDVTRLLNLLH